MKLRTRTQSGLLLRLFCPYPEANRFFPGPRASRTDLFFVVVVVVCCNSFQTQYIDTQDDAYVSGSVTRCQETSLRERFVSAHICHALMHRRRDASDSEVSVRHDLFSLENTLASCWTCLYLVFCAQACLGSWPLVCPGTTPPPH